MSESPAMASIISLAEEVSRTPRLSREMLMRILADCYRIGLAGLSNADRERMQTQIADTRKREGANRSFVQNKDVHTLIIRYVFSAKKERANASRYSTCLTFLAKEQVAPNDFRTEIARRGGLTSIYWIARQRSSKLLSRNKIHLSSTITVEAGVEITLRLLPQPNGVFNVLGLTRSKQ